MVLELMKFLKYYNEITNLDIFIVNESGASVYSASKIAKEEFPDSRFS
jgi:uncharacterized protein